MVIDRVVVWGTLESFCRFHHRFAGGWEDEAAGSYCMMILLHNDAMQCAFRICGESDGGAKILTTIVCPCPRQKNEDEDEDEEEATPGIE